MKRLGSLAGAFAIVLFATAPAWAVPIDISAGDPGTLLPSDDSATLLTFNELAVGPLPSYEFDGGTLSGSGAIEDKSEVNKFAQPDGIDGNFLTVSLPEPAGSVQFNFSKPNNYFGLYWGSLDPYNSITFSYRGNSIGTFSGTEIADMLGLTADGHWSSPSSNRYVNFYTGGNPYDEVTLGTTNYAFEVANVAFGDPPTNVPEPSSLALLASFLMCSSLFHVYRRHIRLSLGCPRRRVTHSSG
jgi:hypothetical protein